MTEKQDRPLYKASETECVIRARGTPSHAELLDLCDDRHDIKAARDALLAALKRAMPWLRKALADGLNDNTAAPMDLPRCIEQADDVIARAEAVQ